MNFIERELNTCCTRWFRGTWDNCCCQHDKCYGKGQGKSECDKEFAKCVFHSKYIGWLFVIPMWTAVHVLGYKYYKGKGMNRKIGLALRSKTITGATTGLGTVTIGAIMLIVHQVSAGDWVGAGFGVFTILTSIFTGLGVVKNRLKTEDENNIKLEDREG